MPVRSLRLIGFISLVGMLLSVPIVSLAQRSAGRAEPWTLERVVLLQRHGVRAPTKRPEALARYSIQPWPRWPVGPGALTAGGRRALAVMASFVRARYTRLGLLPRAGCPAPGRVFVWADSTDERTRMSGEVMAMGLAPGCGIVSRHAAVRVDPLFHGAQSGICPIDARRAAAAIMSRVHGNLNALGGRYQRARRALERVLVPNPRDCASVSAGCLITNGRNRVRIVNGHLKIAGPLHVGASLAEDLLLEYADGLPLPQVAWGRASTERRLAEILPLHVQYAQITRRTPYIAERNGGLLARLMLNILDERRAAGASPAARLIPQSARLVVLAGHDTNLSNLGEILGLRWRLASEPDRTAPDTTLALELWRNRQDGKRYVSPVVLYQTLAQLRAEALRGQSGTRGGPVARTVDLAFPGCARGRCPLPVVRARITRQIRTACVR